MTTRNCVNCKTKFSTADSDTKLDIECYICFYNRVNNLSLCHCHYPAQKCSIKVGDTVRVSSLAGIEYGVVETLNTKLGKADVWFGYHFDSFNLNQLTVLTPEEALRVGVEA